MGFLSRNPRIGSSQEGLPSSSGGSPNPTTKKRWSNLMPLFVALVVVAEIAFLGRLDIVKNAALVNSWTDSFYPFSSTKEVGVEVVDDMGFDALDFDHSSEAESCKEWLEREDTVTYSRDFVKDPVFVSGADKEWKSCAVGCKFGYNPDRKPDAAFGPQESGTASVLRSMESAQYYAENNIAQARRWYLGSVYHTCQLKEDMDKNR